MSLTNFTKKMFKKEKVLDKKKLPSLGLFYADDFFIKIKKATIEDISMYEKNYDKDNVSIIISRIKEVVVNNTTFSKGYSFIDVRSIDIVFIFIEIVKLSTDKKIGFEYIDIETIEPKFIEFNHKNFNYINLSKKTLSKYNSKDKCFEIDGYKYSLPTIGVENCLSEFLIKKEITNKGKEYSKLFYDFTHFLSDKNYLSYDEVENLVHIFNYDIEEKELKKMKKILNTFKPFQKYSLIRNGKVIEVNAKIDLENIWK